MSQNEIPASLKDETPAPEAIRPKMKAVEETLDGAMGHTEEQIERRKAQKYILEVARGKEDPAASLVLLARGHGPESEVEAARTLCEEHLGLEWRPRYRVRRSYTEKTRTAVHDEVRVRAASDEEALRRAKEGDGVPVDGSETTGHVEYTGEIVSSIDVSEVVKDE